MPNNSAYGSLEYGFYAYSGTPGGTPAAGTLIFDTANNKLWAYTGTAWKFITLA
jgi:hypothetical protein